MNDLIEGIVNSLLYVNRCSNGLVWWDTRERQTDNRPDPVSEVVVVEEEVVVVNEG